MSHQNHPLGRIEPVRLLNTILARLAAVSRSGMRDRRLPALASKAEDFGVTLPPLADWIPDRTSYETLRRASVAISQVLHPDFARPQDAIERADNALSALPLPHNRLVNLLRAGAVREVTPTTTSQNVSRRIAGPQRTPSLPAARQPGLQVGAHAWPVHLQPLLPSFPHSLNTQLGSVKLSDEYDTNICIYLDETVPSATTDLGVVAGIVWMASRPDTKVLPLPMQHETRIENDVQALKRLEECPHAIPFIFRFRVPDGHTQTSAYEHVVHECVLFLLGWVIPAQTVGLPPRPGVRVICEALASHGHGLDQTDVLRGVLAQGARRRPEVFSRWVITEAKWVKKSKAHPSQFSARQIDEQGYLAYGDLLAYLTLAAENPSAAHLARIVRLDSFRNYITMTPDLIAAIESLDEDAGSFRASFLDAMAENVRSPFMQTLWDHFRDKWKDNFTIKTRLLEEIDARYLRNDRDLLVLERQLEVVRRLVGDVGIAAPRRVRLLDLGARLQKLNHFGDPLEFQPIQQEYADLRRKALDNGEADLVAHVDLFRAVQAADRFEPGQARLIVEDLLEESPRLAIITKARVTSALGQYLSMEGDREGARDAFDKALGLMEEADVSHADRMADWLQTSVYRAINAIDARSIDTGELVQDIFDKLPWDEESPADQFRHHLWVRYLYAWPEFVDYRREYLESTSEALYPWHPWELIALYRGLFAAEAGRREDAVRWISAAIDIAIAPPHGATLRLIAATIATAGFHVTGQASFGTQAKCMLASSERDPRPLEQAIPAASFAIETLTGLLDEPASPSRMRSALGVLPFNYR
jgi:hypothetical protein